MFLLDTNIVSELRKVRPHGAVVAWLEGMGDANLFLCAVTLSEIQAGIEITREQDPAKAADIEVWADQLAATCKVLPLDAACFRRWAKLMHRQSNTVYEDAMIAATALVHKLTVVTRNVHGHTAAEQCTDGRHCHDLKQGSSSRRRMEGRRTPMRHNPTLIVLLKQAHAENALPLEAITRFARVVAAVRYADQPARRTAFRQDRAGAVRCAGSVSPSFAVRTRN